MGRLIEADKLIEKLHHMIKGDADLRKDYEYLGIDDCIRSMPTAYNVDAVVEQLKCEECEKCPLLDCCIANYHDNFWEKLREIVKGGGVDVKG